MSVIRCNMPNCRREHVHVRCENGEMILVRGPRPYLKARDKLLSSGMWVEHRASLRKLANAILRELDAGQTSVPANDERCAGEHKDCSVCDTIRRGEP